MNQNYFGCDHFSDDEVHEWLDAFLPGLSRQKKFEAIAAPVWCGECVHAKNRHELFIKYASEEYRKTQEYKNYIFGNRKRSIKEKEV